MLELDQIACMKCHKFEFFLRLVPSLAWEIIIFSVTKASEKESSPRLVSYHRATTIEGGVHYADLAVDR
jgi:hypothetical protein